MTVLWIQSAQQLTQESSFTFSACISKMSTYYIWNRLYKVSHYPALEELGFNFYLFLRSKMALSRWERNFSTHRSLHRWRRKPFTLHISAFSHSSLHTWNETQLLMLSDVKQHIHLKTQTAVCYGRYMI